MVPSGCEAIAGGRQQNPVSDVEDDADSLSDPTTGGATRQSIQEDPGSDEEDGVVDSLSDLPSLQQLAEALEVLQREEEDGHGARQSKT